MAVTLSQLKIKAVTLSNTMHRKSQLFKDQHCKYSFLSNPRLQGIVSYPSGSQEC